MTGERAPLLGLRGATIGYRGGPALPGVDLEVARGDFLGVVGPNGAGKSTLLKTLLGILPPLEGERTVAADLCFGYVPQRSQLDPIFPLSAVQVVGLGGMGAGAGPGRGLRAAPRRAAIEALDRLGVARLADKPFRSLSGGQQQRVLIARALVRHPDLLVLDEPTAGMDIPSESDILDFVQALNREQQTTVLMVVHHIEVVASRATDIALVNMETDLFATGSAAELLTTERLTSLYRRPIEVVGADGEVHVHAGRQAPGEGGAP